MQHNAENTSQTVAGSNVIPKNAPCAGASQKNSLRRSCFIMRPCCWLAL